jgi:hypothetical protein
MQTIKERRPPITHVAIRFQGKIFSLPRPNRHHDVIRKIVEELGVDCVDSYDSTQGFLDESGRFLTRKQAIINAHVNNQLLTDRQIYCNELCSENLW